MGFLIYRELTIGSLLKSIKDTAITTSVIFSIIAMATFLSKVFTYTQFPQFIIKSITDMGVGLNFFWFAMALICLILGTFIEIVPVFYLTIPIFTAIILSFDQSLIHLYVVFVAFAGIGMITPPVCVGIYTSASVIKENPGNAFKEVPLFTVVGILYGILMILFPGLSTWLPNIYQDSINLYRFSPFPIKLSRSFSDRPILIIGIIKGFYWSYFHHISRHKNFISFRNIFK